MASSPPTDNDIAVDEPDPEVEQTNGLVDTGFVDGVGDAPPITATDLGIELPDEHHDAVEMLLGELARAREAVDERTADLQRVAAEFDNYRKRVARDQDYGQAQAVERVVRELLPVLDSFDAGLSVDVETATEQRLLDGLQGTATQLWDGLGRLGLAAVPAVGQPFDPEVHEAVMAAPDMDQPIVTQELRRGYTLGGRLLRAAMVALGPAEEAE